MGGLAAASIIPSNITNSIVKKFGQAPYVKNSKIANKVLVIGMDGMDPDLVRRFVSEGAMPNFKKMMSLGQFGNLQSTMPPHSPVAWSSFITGCNPGGHGIYDFIHRDPKTFTPYMSTSRSFDSKDNLQIGGWSVPLKPGHVDLMRKGPAFWTTLEERGIPTTVLQIPANFPITTKSVKAISGMGTPDLLGTYGTYTYITDTDVPNASELTGGKVVKVIPINHLIEAKVKGPKNSMKVGSPAIEFNVKVQRDPYEPVAKIDIEGHEMILRQGEWSEWIPLSFSLIPMFASVGGMVRVYLQEVHPHFKMYLSPINVDPMEPTLPICSPSGYSKELSQAVGRFYTQGFPADTKALSEGILSYDEYFTQSHLALDESMRLFNFELNRFNEGVFFFYFSTTDQNSHMLWSQMDPTHPLHEPDQSLRVKNSLKSIYQTMDVALGQALEKIDSYTTLMVLSDHGFSPFTREFNLNTWLYNNGYLALTDPTKLEDGEFFRYVDWSKTKAYGLGINGLYLNVKDREKRGSINEKEAQTVKKEIMAKLPQVKDPKNGNPVITTAYDPFKLYSGPFVDLAPDLVIGYQRGYRSSDETVLGTFIKEEITDRTNKWSADHCMDPALVPGILLSNKKWQGSPNIWDLAPTILSEFGITPPKEMDGKRIFV